MVNRAVSSAELPGSLLADIRPVSVWPTCGFMVQALPWGGILSDAPGRTVAPLNLRLKAMSYE
jgi:hypothetical protein